MLHCRVRYFDPVRRRAGMPQNVAALVEKLTADSITLTLVNVHQTQPREVIIQAGGYAEHQFVNVDAGLKGVAPTLLNARHVTVRLAPGCGQRLVFRMKRYANAPTMTFPWDR